MIQSLQEQLRAKEATISDLTTQLGAKSQEAQALEQKLVGMQQQMETEKLKGIEVCAFVCLPSSCSWLLIESISM